jgi:hypothetical protein
VLELAEIVEYAKYHTIDEIRKNKFDDEELAKVTGIDSDDRGILLPAQISPTTPVPSDEPPPNENMTPPIVTQNETTTPILPIPTEAGNPEMPEQEAEQPYVQGSELRAELKK